MTSKWVWVALVVVIVVAGGLWWSGIFNQSNQGAAVVTSTTQGDPGLNNVALKSDLGAVDAQLATVNKNISALATTSTKAQIATTAGSVSSAIAAINALSKKLSSRVVNTKTAGGATPPTQTFGDISNQLSNAGSLASTASKNAGAASSTPTMLSTSVSQLKSAQSDLAAARADIISIFKILGIQ